ncbi:cytochrome P450 [Nesterenkonia alba]|uniref:cytochrome P450 n=1 Tax=Nesterenkonia alba TaxID=515814 RepID=UPI00048E0099|nr:cytochrome P450 [Nesterenkonia alba]
MSTHSLPPGPRTPAAVQTLQFYSRRQSAFPAFHTRYGDTFTLRAYPGPVTYVMFTRPEDIKEIFAGDSWEFSGAGGNEVLRAAVGDNSVMLNDGAAHRRMRKYLMPAFSPRAVRAYRPRVEEIVTHQVSTWRPGEKVTTLQAMSGITLEVMLQLVFGLTTGERMTQLRPRLLKLVDVDPLLALGWMYPRTLTRIPPWRGPQKNLEAIDELIYAEIAERRASGGTGQDMLSHLLQVTDDAEAPLSEQEIRDQLVTLVLAGYETTASALSWTLHELARHPQIQQRAADAAAEGDEDYLEACLKEGMRLHPIIDFVVKILRSEQTIGGWTLPAGTGVVPAIMLTHHDETHHDDAASFRPERFLGENTPAANTWIPFGGGVRRCVGAAFATMEGVVSLKEILTRFRLSAEKPAPTTLRNITNVPGDGAPVRLQAR